LKVSILTKFFCPAIWPPPLVYASGVQPHPLTAGINMALLAFAAERPCCGLVLPQPGYLQPGSVSNSFSAAATGQTNGRTPYSYTDPAPLGLPAFPRRNTGDFCPSIHPSPVRPMCRYRPIIPCMLPSEHKFHTSSEHR